MARGSVVAVLLVTCAAMSPLDASAQDATALVRTRHDSVRALLRRPARPAA